MEGKTMRQMISYILSFTFLVAFTFVSSNYVQGANIFHDDDDDGDCDTLKGTATAVVTGPDTASEKIIFQLDKKAYTADSSIRFSIVPQPDGSLGAVSTHFLIVKDKHNKQVGTISTSDTGVLTPISPGVFNLSSDLKIVSGTGKFKKSTGTIHADVVLDFTTDPPSSTSVVNGTICKIDD
jgi:hypothetical protein